MNIPNNIQIELRIQAYFNLSFQYYLLARQGILFKLIPIAGNLVHHAIETLLLAGISRTNSFSQLKKKYHNHDLLLIWKEFKTIFPKENLEQFNKVIARYNKWEEIRYPKDRQNNIVMIFDMRKSEESKINYPKYNKDSEYRINLEELDEFFKKISLMFINPDFFKTSFWGEQKILYEKDNYHVIN